MYNSELWTMMQTLGNSMDVIQRKLLRIIIHLCKMAKVDLH